MEGGRKKGRVKIWDGLTFVVTRRCREDNLEEIKDGRFDLIWVVAVVRPEHRVDDRTGRWAEEGARWECEASREDRSLRMERQLRFTCSLIPAVR